MRELFSQLDQRTTMRRGMFMPFRRTAAARW
jgi:hypothetical protein